MFLKKVVLALVAILVFLVPLGSGRISFNINIGQFGLMSLIGIFAFLFAIAHLLFGNQRLGRAQVPMDPSVTLFGVFVAFNFASVGWAELTSVAISSSITYLQLLIFVWLLLFLRSEPRAFGILLHAFLMGSLLVAGVALYDITTVGLEAFADQRYGGFEIEVNILGVKLALGVAVVLYLFQRGILWLRWLYLAYVPAAAFLFVLTGSRTGFALLVFVVLVGVWSILKVQDQGRARWSGQRVLILLAVAVPLAFVVVPKVSDQFRFHTERLVTITEDDKTGAGGREHLWAAAFAAYADNPVLGVGSGGSRYVLRHYVGHDGLMIALPVGDRVAHNAFLGIAADTGTVGAFLFLLVLLSLILRIASFQRPEKLFFLSLMGVALIAGLALSLEQTRDFYFALFLSVAMAVSRSPASDTHGADSSAVQRSPLVDTHVRGFHGQRH
jgi:O-antigen ligase